MKHHLRSGKNSERLKVLGQEGFEAQVLKQRLFVLGKKRKLSSVSSADPPKGNAPMVFTEPLYSTQVSSLCLQKDLAEASLKLQQSFHQNLSSLISEQRQALHNLTKLLADPYAFLQQQQTGSLDGFMPQQPHKVLEKTAPRPQEIAFLQNQEVRALPRWAPCQSSLFSSPTPLLDMGHALPGACYFDNNAVKRTRSASLGSIPAFYKHNPWQHEELELLIPVSQQHNCFLVPSRLPVELKQDQSQFADDFAESFDALRKHQLQRVPKVMHYYNPQGWVQLADFMETSTTPREDFYKAANERIQKEFDYSVQCHKENSEKRVLQIAEFCSVKDMPSPEKLLMETKSSLVVNPSTAAEFEGDDEMSFQFFTA